MEELFYSHSLMSVLSRAKGLHIFANYKALSDYIKISRWLYKEKYLILKNFHMNNVYNYLLKINDMTILQHE